MRYMLDKELEALEEIERDIKDRIILAEDRQLKLCEVIKQALLELQAVKEAKPSEAMEALDRNIVVIREKDYTIIEQYILKAEKLEKAWEVVKEKRVDFYILSIRNTVEDYNGLYYDIHNSYDVVSYLLTQEEFDLLKEMIK